MKEQSTTKGFAALSAAGMMVKILSLLYIPFLRIVIGGEGYGIYSAAYQVYAFVFVLTNSGIPVAISKLVSELIAVRNYRDAVKSFKIARFGLLLIGIVMSALLLVFAMPLANAVHYRKAYLSLAVLTPAVLFTSIASSYRGYFQGRANMTPTAISQVLEQVVNTVFTLVFAAYFMKFGVEVGCAGGTIGTSLGALCSATFLIFYYEKNKKFKVPKGFSHIEVKRFTTKQLVRRIILYAVPVTICVGMTYAGNLVDLYNTKVRLMAGGFQDTQATILYGFLVIYQQLMNVPIAIITSLSAAILPAISAAAAVRNKKLVKGRIDYSFRLCFLVALPSAVGLAVLSEPIFSLFKCNGGSYLMTYGSVVLILMSVMQIQTTILQSIGRLFTATYYSVIGIAFKITVNYFLIAIPKINILGAVFGSIVGFLIPVILNHRIIKKSLNIKQNIISQAVKPALSSALMGIAVYIIYFNLHVLFNIVKRGYVSNAFATILSVIVGGYVYLFCLIITGGITRKDLESIPKKLVRFFPRFMLKKVH